MIKKDLSKVLQPYDPLCNQAVEALKVYHKAQAHGVVGAELERLRLLAEHGFQVVTVYQLSALLGEMESKGHEAEALITPSRRKQVSRSLLTLAACV